MDVIFSTTIFTETRHQATFLVKGNKSFCEQNTPVSFKYYLDSLCSVTVGLETRMYECFIRIYNTVKDKKRDEIETVLSITQCSLGIYTFPGKHCSGFKEVLCIFPDLPNEFHLIRSLTLCRGCMCAQLVKIITPEAIPM